MNGFESGDTSVLTDQFYRSHDEKHIWQRSLDEKVTFPLTLQVHFASTIHLALLRIWNHNKSRIYWDRGIRDIELYLDHELIFRGEITRAHGSLTGPVQNLGDVSNMRGKKSKYYRFYFFLLLFFLFFQTILFTTDDQILEKIAQNDKFFK